MNWMQAIQTAIRSPEVLCNMLDLPAHQMGNHYAINPNFPVKVPLPFVQRMQPSNWHDPLLRQVLSPIARHPLQHDFVADPLHEQEEQYHPIPGVLHKYAGRILVISTGACAIHCQYCFRQNFPYDLHQMGHSQWQAVLEYIRARPTIHEIIFSGGDPLMHKDETWGQWITDLAAIAHVQTVRIHTRLPVVIPARLTPSWIRAVQHERLRTVLVLHTNHPQEWDASLTSSVRRVVQAGICVLHQGVILKGINDDPACLIRMSHTLWAAQVLPYYWHVLDPVIGAEDFAIDIRHIPAWEHTLREALPGYLVPRFVQEIPGMKSKQHII